MTMEQRAEGALGINGLGRIGKLTLWHHVARRYFPRLVVNLGREVGSGLEAVCGVIEKDSTYGPIHRFLFGVNSERCVKILDSKRSLLEVAGLPVEILQTARNPKDLDWRSHGVRVVVDTTGAFKDPSTPAAHPAGALRGHLEAGAEKVVNSAAFKVRDRGQDESEDSVTLIYGINHQIFDPVRHHLISAASCTTTALAHMVKPLIEHLNVSNIITASMSTVHAATQSQSVLDSVPKAGASDLRRNRSALNSIILTSTNAANTLEQVIPEMRQIGFMADSVRIPTPTESLIILNITFQTKLEDERKSFIDRNLLNGIYQKAASAQPGLLVYSEEQNVPSDLIGMRAAVVIEGVATHTRTGFVDLQLNQVPGVPAELESTSVQVPVTHAKIVGWYDNEFGSYTNLLGDLTVHVHRMMD